MRVRVAVFTAVLVTVSVLAFAAVFRPQSARISETNAQREEAEQRISQLQLELGQLRALQAEAPRLRERAQRVDTAIPSDPQLAQFILLVQEAATAAGIDWLAISPTPPAAQATTTTTPAQPAAPAVQEVNISMSVNGGYFQVQDFLTRLETLPRAVKISGVTLAPGPGGLPQLASALTLKMFVASVPAT